MARPPDLRDAPHLTYELIDGDRALAAGLSLTETSGQVPGCVSDGVRLPRTQTVVRSIEAICLGGSGAGILAGLGRS